MFCKNCGSEITSDQLFCPHCGTKNEQQAPNPIPSQVLPNQIPNQVAPNPIPNQIPPNQVPNQVAPNPIPNQVPPNQVPPNQVPNQMSQNQIPNQMSQGQLPPYSSGNQVPPIPPVPPRNSYMGSNQVPPNSQLPPPVPPHIYEANRKKNKALVPIVIGVAVLLLILGIAAAVGVVRYAYSVQDTEASELSDLYFDDLYTEDTTDDSLTEDTTDSILDDMTEGYDDNLIYTYSELPDVASMDSDNRFTCYDYSSGTDSGYYTFQFNDITATESDFYAAVDSYGALLMNQYGFAYDEYWNSNGSFDSSDEYTDYFLRDDVLLDMITSVEDTGMYVYITIGSATMDATEDTSEDITDDSMEDATEDTTEDTTTDYAYPNYAYYIDGRDTQYFEFGNEIQMENGIAFYLNSADIYDLGDGTQEIDCNMDLAALNADTYLYTDSFVVVPTDSEGYILGDAALISYVTDSEGNYVTEPYLLDTENYYNYTVTFIVPEGTTSMTIYGTNVKDEYSAGPVYYFDMEVVEE